MHASSPIPRGRAFPIPPSRAARGFTLIELLTVIAIIGILAAILIPVVGSVRAKARSAQCGSNHRQIALAIRLYTNDNKGQIPWLSRANGGDSSWWTNLLVDGGYVPPGEWRAGGKNWGQAASGVFRCPSMQDPLGWYGGIALSNAVAGHGRSANINRIIDQARVSLVADAPSNEANTSASPGINKTTGTTWSGGLRITRHNNGGNVAFVDGHVARWPEIDLLANKFGLFDRPYAF